MAQKERLMRREKPLSWQQIKVLHNLACDLHPMSHIRGRSAHGAFGQTMDSLERRCLIRGRFTDAPQLTVGGVRQHQALCCKEGRTVDDMIVDQTEKRLEGKDPEPLRVYHDQLEKISDSPFKVRCPACKEGILMVSRDPVSLRLLRGDTCTRCGQLFRYRDQKIGGEEIIEEVDIVDDGEE